MRPHVSRLRAGSYITDGSNLYEITRVRATGPGVRVTIENCITFSARQLDVLKLRNFRLVRAAEVDELP
jgi:hypothetical protein